MKIIISVENMVLAGLRIRVQAHHHSLPPITLPFSLSFLKTKELKKIKKPPRFFLPFFI
jgi:hypothetical protein